MKKYKFIGTEQEASDYDIPKPKVGEVYDAEVLIGERIVDYWANGSLFRSEWEEVTEEEVDKKTSFPTPKFPLGGHVVEAITELKRRTLPTPKQLSNAYNYIDGKDFYHEDEFKIILDILSIYLTKGTPTLDDLDNLKQ